MLYFYVTHWHSPSLRALWSIHWFFFAPPPPPPVIVYTLQWQPSTLISRDNCPMQGSHNILLILPSPYWWKMSLKMEVGIRMWTQSPGEALVGTVLSSHTWRAGRCLVAEPKKWVVAPEELWMWIMQNGWCCFMSSFFLAYSLVFSPDDPGQWKSTARWSMKLSYIFEDYLVKIYQDLVERVCWGKFPL